MYNMELTIGPAKFRLEIVILIIIILWILFGHLLCSCCSINFNGKSYSYPESMSTLSSSLGTSLSSFSRSLTEGFSAYNNKASNNFTPANSPAYLTKPSTWGIPNLTYSPGTTPDAAIQAIWDRPPQPVPLPKGEMYMFATTQFKPECCPNTFTSSTGCACMTVDQYQYLLDRGGNNVPYSQY